MFQPISDSLYSDNSNVNGPRKIAGPCWFWLNNVCSARLFRVHVTASEGPFVPAIGLRAPDTTERSKGTGDIGDSPDNIPGRVRAEFQYRCRFLEIAFPLWTV